MLQPNDIAAALNLTGVKLYEELLPDGTTRATITADQPVTPEMQAKVQRWHLAGRIDLDAEKWADFLSGSITLTGPAGPIALKASIEARDAFTGQIILIREALDAGLLSQTSPISIWDASEQEHQMTVAQCRQLLLGYGIGWQSAFAALAP
jgi:hypothetical protein